MILVLTAGMLPAAVPVKADDKEISIEDIEKSIDSVVKAVDNLKGIIEPEQVSVISSIFSGFTATLGAVGSFVGPINGTVSFLKLIGLMKDGTSEALANISAQLTNINEKISQMDAKLDMITEQMQLMKASEEFNARVIKATQMISAWHLFEANYIEDKMDELLRQYNVLLLDSMKEWVEYRTEEARHKGNVDTNKVIIWYRCTNPPDVDSMQDWTGEYELQATDANEFSQSKSTEVPFPDPYVIYADQYDSRVDKYVILDSTFFPAAGEMPWDVNMYRDNLKSYIKNRINGYFDAKDFSHFTAWNFYAFTEYGDDAERTPELVDEIAENAVDQIVFRVCSNSVNSSSDFASKAVLQFKEYCTHLRSAQQGLDAMMKTMYLTHGFEYEIADDFKNFMDEMSLKTGVYGLFVTHVAGMSKSVSNSDRNSVLEEMCLALDRISDSKEAGLTGCGSYCYITGSMLNYGEITFSSSADVFWRSRGTYYAYRSCSGGSFQTRFSHEGSTEASTGSLIGDSNAVLITYVMSAGGESFDQDFMNQHLTDKPKTNHGPLITSVDGEDQMTADANITLKTSNIIGDYFSGDPVVYPRSLPKKAEFGYLNIRRMIKGTLYDPKAVKLTVHTPLTAIAVYGENHNLWVVDESAVMGGPAGMNSFSSSQSKEQTDSDILSNNYFTTHHNQSVTYNCLLSFPVPKVKASEDGFDPLADLQAFLAEDTQNNGVHMHEWDEGVVIREPSADEPGVILHTCLTDPSHVMEEPYPAAETVALTFDPAGGIMRGQSGAAVMEFEKGSEILLPQGPEKEGYTFLYWDSGEFPEDAAFTVTEPRTFTAVYEEYEGPAGEPVVETGPEGEKAASEGSEAVSQNRSEKGAELLAGAENREESVSEKDADKEKAPLTAENSGTGEPAAAQGSGGSKTAVIWVIVVLACAAAVCAALAVRKKRRKE